MRLINQLLRKCREELEQLRPPKGMKKWMAILSNFRVAGAPRSVITCEMIVVIADLIADAGVLEEIKKFYVQQSNFLLSTPAYAERAWLDERKLENYLAEFRAQGYVCPSSEA